MPLSRLCNVVVAALAACLCTCGTADRDGRSSRLAVLSAFPSELAPLLEQTRVNETIMVGDRVLRTGVLRGVPVVLGVTGIGLVNGAATTRAVLEKFEVRGPVPPENRQKLSHQAGACCSD